MKKISLSLALLIFSNFALGQSSVQSSTVSLRHTYNPGEPTWTTEAVFNTISNSQQPTYGASLFYSLNLRNELGTRALTPIDESSRGTTSIMAVYRHHMSESKTHLFAEGTLGINYYSYISKETSAASLGSNLGVIHRFNDRFAAGGIGGIEWTQTSLSSGYANNVPNSICAYLRVALFGSMTF